MPLNNEIEEEEAETKEKEIEEKEDTEELINALLDKPENLNKFLDKISHLDSVENQSILLSLFINVCEYFENKDPSFFRRNTGLLVRFHKLFKMLGWKLIQEDNNKPNPISFEDILYAEEYWEKLISKEEKPLDFEKANKRALKLVWAALHGFDLSGFGACIYLAFMYNAAAHTSSGKKKQEYMDNKEFYMELLLPKIDLCLEDNKGELRYGYAYDNMSTVHYVYYFEYKGIQTSFHCTFPPPSNCSIPEWHSEEWDHIRNYGKFPLQLEWFDL